MDFGFAQIGQHSLWKKVTLMRWTSTLTEIVYGSVRDGRFGVIVSVAADRVAVTERFAAVDDVVRAGTVCLTLCDQSLVPSGKIIGELDRHETYFGKPTRHGCGHQVLAIGAPFGAGNGGQGGSVYLFSISRVHPRLRNRPPNQTAYHVARRLRANILGLPRSTFHQRG